MQDADHNEQHATIAPNNNLFLAKIWEYHLIQSLGLMTENIQYDCDISLSSFHLRDLPSLSTSKPYLPEISGHLRRPSPFSLEKRTL